MLAAAMHADTPATPKTSSQAACDFFAELGLDLVELLASKLAGLLGAGTTLMAATENILMRNRPERALKSTPTVLQPSSAVHWQ